MAALLRRVRRVGEVTQRLCSGCEAQEPERVAAAERAAAERAEPRRRPKELK
jgi:hypothetical protein